MIPFIFFVELSMTGAFKKCNFSHSIFWPFTVLKATMDFHIRSFQREMAISYQQVNRSCFYNIPLE